MKKTGIPTDRRTFLNTLAGTLAAGTTTFLGGCVSIAQAGKPDLVWGRRGMSSGRFLKPRAIAIDSRDQLYIVDTTGRIQVFDGDGNHLREWKTPETKNGRPTGLQIRAADQRLDREILLVADTHYYRVLAYELDGQLIESECIGGEAGFGPGQFAFVTEAVCDRHGCTYVGEYGDSDRIQKFDPDGAFVCQWGTTGREPGQFLRPQSMLVNQDVLIVLDACNHRIQRFDLTTEQPEFMDAWGGPGSGLGQFMYPYDVAAIPGGADDDVDLLICEYGNQRLQRVALDGDPRQTWGGPGHAPGQLYQPWGAVVDSQGRVHVLDSNNHRVQRITRWN